MTALLTIEDVATELCVPPLAVKRLVALRLLPGTQVGQNEFRILPTALQSYIYGGAKQLAFPPVDQDENGALLPPMAYNDLVLIEKKIRQIIAAAAPVDRPNDVKTGMATFKIDLPMPPELRSFLQEKPSKPVFTPPGTPPNPYSSKAAWYAAARLAMNIEKLTKDATQTSDGLDLLYRSPEDFDRITNQAWTDFQAYSVRISKTYPSLPTESWAVGATVSFGVSASQFGATKDVFKIML